MVYSLTRVVYCLQSALHVAVVTGNHAVIDALVSAGASPDLQDLSVTRVYIVTRVLYCF